MGHLHERAQKENLQLFKAGARNTSHQRTQYFVDSDDVYSIYCPAPSEGSHLTNHCPPQSQRRSLNVADTQFWEAHVRSRLGKPWCLG